MQLEEILRPPLSQSLHFPSLLHASLMSQHQTDNNDICTIGFTLDTATEKCARLGLALCCRFATVRLGSRIGCLALRPRYDEASKAS